MRLNLDPSAAPPTPTIEIPLRSATNPLIAGVCGHCPVQVDAELYQLHWQYWILFSDLTIAAELSCWFKSKTAT